MTDPVVKMNWHSTWHLKNKEPCNPLAQYILRCRKGKSYPANMAGDPIHDWPDPEPNNGRSNEKYF